MSTYRKFVGLGVHKDTIVVAVAYAGREGADPKSAGPIRRVQGLTLD